MKTVIKLYTDIVTKVKFFFKQLNLKLHKNTGRKLSVNPEEIISLYLWKQVSGIPSKKQVFLNFKENLKCSYKTFVVNMNRWLIYALLILKTIFKFNKQNSHIIKHTDSTDIPVCLNKNAKHHKTMKGLASWGNSGKGFFYGLKLSLTSDLFRNILAVWFGSGSSNDRETFKKMNKDLEGIFVADAGYISRDLEKEFYKENKRMLLAKPKKNMKRLATEFQLKLYETRMLIELNFRSLKMFNNLVTSLPRSIDGYLANYVFSLLAYVLCK